MIVKTPEAQVYFPKALAHITMKVDFELLY